MFKILLLPPIFAIEALVEGFNAKTGTNPRDIDYMAQKLDFERFLPAELFAMGYRPVYRNIRHEEVWQFTQLTDQNKVCVWPKKVEILWCGRQKFEFDIDTASVGGENISRPFFDFFSLLVN